jgi:hypothetical protein
MIGPWQAEGKLARVEKKEAEMRALKQLKVRTFPNCSPNIP